MALGGWACGGAEGRESAPVDWQQPPERAPSVSRHDTLEAGRAP